MKTLSGHTPSWIIALKPGEYTLTDIVRISGSHKAAASKLLREYGAKRKYIPVENSHLTRVLFIWEGVRQG